MTDLEIGNYIDNNMRHEDGTPMIDLQAFYEGAKWMRDQALNTSNVSGSVCCLCKGENWIDQGILTNPCPACGGKQTDR
jgi:hypothetical protein